jgi:thiamine biosynthesis lipoprotein
MGMHIIRIVRTLAVISCVYIVSSCAGHVSLERTEIALGTYVKTVVITDKQHRDRAQATVEELYELLFSYEGVFDYRSADGELHHFNSGEVFLRSESASLFQLIVESVEYAGLTEGFFDPTILPLIEVWGFDSNEPRIPHPQEISRALALVDHTKITIGSDRIRKPPSTRLDLSGIAKGKLVDMASQYLRNADFNDFLVDAGGDIYVSGRNLNRQKWRVAIQDPLRRDRYSGILEKSDAAIVTSGDYENFFMEEGKRYSHLLSPYTGYPDSDIRSVTIVADTAAFGDAVATAVFVMGSGDGYRFLLDAGIEGYIIYGDEPLSLETAHFWD